MARIVRILMATRNGAAHLAAQLDSLRDQTHADWELWAGDDGSTDATPDILARFAADEAAAAGAPGRAVRILPGPGAGSARNFLALLSHPDLDPGAGPVAFADQDDVWLPHKLARALAALEAGAPGRPAVYASRSLLTGPALENPRPSRLFGAGASFGNALVQNVLPGNTIVLNAAAAGLLARAAPAAAAAGVPFHDWWIYQVMAGAGARLVIDPEPGLYYRQHGGNLMGANSGAAGALGRAGLILGGRFSDWIDRNLAALGAVEDLLTPEARATLAGFAALRGRAGPGAVRGMARLGIRRQDAAARALLAAVAFAGRL